MGGRLDLEVASFLVFIEVAGKRAFDIPGPGVMALDEIAVVAVHQAHEIGEVSGRGGMQSGAEGGACRRECRDRVGNLFRRLLQPGRFDPRWRFNDVVGRCHDNIKVCLSTA